MVDAGRRYDGRRASSNRQGRYPGLCRCILTTDRRTVEGKGCAAVGFVGGLGPRPAWAKWGVGADHRTDWAAAIRMQSNGRRYDHELCERRKRRGPLWTAAVVHDVREVCSLPHRMGSGGGKATFPARQARRFCRRPLTDGSLSRFKPWLMLAV